MNNKLKVTSKVTKLGVWNDIPSDSINSFILEFEFDEGWADLVCVAQFGQGNNTYNQLIVDNKCSLPTELNVGELRISVFGSKTDGTAYRSTTIPLATEIIQSGFDGHGEDTIPPSPDLYEQLLEEFSNGGVHTINGLKSDVTLIDGDNTTVTTDTENGEISVNVAVDNALSDSSENPVQNKVIKSTLDTQDALTEKIANKITEFTGTETDAEYPSAKLTLDSLTSLAEQTSSALDGKLDLTGGIMTGNIQLTDGARIQVQGTANNPAITMASRRIGTLGDPVTDYDATNKRYVDNAIAAALIVDTEEVIP